MPAKLRVCRDCEDEFNPNHKFHSPKGLLKHSEVGFIDQCGDCGLEDDNPVTDRYIALEEGNGSKEPCTVTPISPDLFKGGCKHYLTYVQHYQPIGSK